jgi:hypothetical protein
MPYPIVILSGAKNLGPARPNVILSGAKNLGASKHKLSF